MDDIGRRGGIRKLELEMRRRGEFPTAEEAEMRRVPIRTQFD